VAEVPGTGQPVDKRCKGGDMMNHMKYRPTHLLVSCLLLALLFPSVLFAASAELGERLVREQCVTCHKFEGAPESKFNLKAPDLMWGGNKYQRPWLIRWLTGKEENLYPNGYRWDKGTGPQPHVVLSAEGAEAVADYLYNNFNLGSDRVVPFWYGADNPIAGNDTDAGRAKNRRVEISIGGL
jgi:hypothetical protein